MLLTWSRHAQHGQALASRCAGSACIKKHAKRNTLQCRYHGWTYSLDGTLRRAPEMQGVQRFDPDSMHLVPVQVASWGPLVFVNVDGKAPPLTEVLEDLPGRLAPFHCE